MENNHFALESQISKIYELKSRFEKELENFEQTKPQYDALIDIIEKSGRIEELPPNFLEGVKKDRQELETAGEVIGQRLGILKILVDKYEAIAKENNENTGIETNSVNEILTLVFYGLGIANFDVPENKEESEEVKN